MCGPVITSATRRTAVPRKEAVNGRVDKAVAPGAYDDWTTAGVEPSAATPRAAPTREGSCGQTFTRLSVAVRVRTIRGRQIGGANQVLSRVSHAHHCGGTTQPRFEMARRPRWVSGIWRCRNVRAVAYRVAASPPRPRQRRAASTPSPVQRPCEVPRLRPGRACVAAWRTLAAPRLTAIHRPSLLTHLHAQIPRVSTRASGAVRTNRAAWTQRCTGSAFGEDQGGQCVSGAVVPGSIGVALTAPSPPGCHTRPSAPAGRCVGPPRAPSPPPPPKKKTTSEVQAAHEPIYDGGRLDDGLALPATGNVGQMHALVNGLCVEHIRPKHRERRQRCACASNQDEAASKTENCPGNVSVGTGPGRSAHGSGHQAAHRCSPA